MKLNEVVAGTAGILDIEVNGTSKFYTCYVTHAQNKKKFDVPCIVAEVCEGQEFENLPTKIIAKSLYLSERYKDPILFLNISLIHDGRTAVLSTTLLSTYSDRRSSLRYEIYCHAMIQLEDVSHGLFSIKIKNICENGIAFYADNDPVFSPGISFKIVSAQDLPDFLKNDITSLEGKSGKILRIQEADYNRILIGAKLD